MRLENGPVPCFLRLHCWFGGEAGAYLFSMQTLCYNCRKVLTSYVCSLMILSKYKCSFFDGKKFFLGERAEKQLKKEGKPTNVEEDDPELVGLKWERPRLSAGVGMRPQPLG